MDSPIHEQIRSAQLRFASIVAAFVGSVGILLFAELTPGWLVAVTVLCVGSGTYGGLLLLTDKRIFDEYHVEEGVLVWAEDEQDDDEQIADDAPEQPARQRVYVDVAADDGGGDATGVTVHGRTPPSNCRAAVKRLGSSSHDPVLWLNRHLNMPEIHVDWPELAHRAKLSSRYTTAILRDGKGKSDSSKPNVVISPIQSRDDVSAMLTHIGVLSASTAEGGGTRYTIMPFGVALFAYIVWMNEQNLLPHTQQIVAAAAWDRRSGFASPPPDFDTA